MELERDEFIVQYDASRSSLEDLMATSKSTGFPATVVKDTPSSETPAFFETALTRAKSERKLLVVDFTASWCPPCQKMLRETFPDPLVADLLGERCVLVTVDTDEHPRIAQRYSVVGLPDIRFLSPDGEEMHRQRDFQDAEQFEVTLKRLVLQVERADNLVDVADEEKNVREIFNQDSEHVRLLLVLSPT